MTSPPPESPVIPLRSEPARKNWVCDLIIAPYANKVFFIHKVIFIAYLERADCRSGERAERPLKFIISLHGALSFLPHFFKRAFTLHAIETVMGKRAARDRPMDHVPSF